MSSKNKAMQDDMNDSPASEPVPPPAPQEGEASSESRIRDGAHLPVLPLSDTVLFPYLALPLAVNEPGSVQLINDLVGGDRIAVFSLKLPESPQPASPGPEEKEPRDRPADGSSPEEPSPPETVPEGSPVHPVGCAGRILKMIRLPDDTMRILVQGIERVRIRKIVRTEPYAEAEIERLPEILDASKETEALARQVLDSFRQVTELSPALPEELNVAAANAGDPGRLADFIASSINLRPEQKQEVLATLRIRDRLRKILAFLHRETEVLQIGAEIQNRVQQSLSKSQREYFLREQLRAIRQELGEEDERGAETRELREQIEKANLPEEARKAAERELERLSRMPPASAEYTVARTYIDWILCLPWAVETEDHLDVREAARILDEDHHALEKVKERILEYLAVLKLNRDLRSPILCFVGPPGVGKTSLGQSIARALGRRFVRISLGGVRDEAEIRGHRRTYVGAMPGRILQGLRRAESRNPVFMLDEIDKLGADFRGDPAAALLEVLDPQQNSAFADHYIEVPFDLSRILFITTANQLETIPPALLDRMEVLRLSGYTEQEKVVIASRFLLPRQIREHGLKKSQVRITRAALTAVIRDYTREAGVRNLERQLAAICRKIARAVAEKRRIPKRIEPRDLRRYLGIPRFSHDAAEREMEPGVATGLAWTPAGGDILFIEATKMPGRGRLTLTGQLGDVMRESATAALSYVRSRAEDLRIAQEFDKIDLHIHIPAGAIPKDGPSAGLTLIVALVSLLTNRPVRPEVAMTGEITLRGKVLPVGGIKEKVLAAARAGIREILLPAENRRDLTEIPAEIRGKLRFRFATTVDQAIRTALTPAKAAGKKASGSRRSTARKKTKTK